jgi:Nop53 (60S ribosomal biogenesis)
LKADEILAQRSAVPAVYSRKRTNSKTTDGITEPSSNKRRKNWVSSKDLQRLKDSLDENSQLSSRRLEDGEDVAVDLWSGGGLTENKTGYDYLEQHMPKVAPPTVSHAPIAMTSSGRPVKAVKTPNPGASYNPSFTDWDDLLNQEGQKAVEAEKKRFRAEQLETDRAARIATIASDDAPGGLTDAESAWEGFESEYENSEWLNKKRPERKTQAQRNKIKRRKQAEREALHQAKMVDKRKQARELEQLANKEAEESDTGQVAVVADGEISPDEGDDSMLRRKRLRNVSIPEKNLEVVLPDELQESLRRLKPEGNLLNDRFRHLLVNGKIEARKPILQPKKKRVTYTEKWTHKDFQIAV